MFAIDADTYKVIGHLVVHPRPRSVAFLPDGSRAFIPSESVGELNVIDTASQTLVKVITLPQSSRPQCVLVSPDGKKIYASTGRGGTVVVVDANTYEVLNTIPVGKRPWGIAFSPDGKYLFAANGPSDDVSVVDLATEKEIARVNRPAARGAWSPCRTRSRGINKLEDRRRDGRWGMDGRVHLHIRVLDRGSGYLVPVAGRRLFLRRFKVQLDGFEQVGGEPADRFLHRAHGRVGVLASGIAEQADVIIWLGLGTGTARLRNVREENRSDADGFRLATFHLNGGAAGGDGAGNQPRFVQRRAQKSV